MTTSVADYMINLFKNPEDSEQVTYDILTIKARYYSMGSNTKVKWDFKHRPDREYEWETYYSPQGLEMGALYEWCRETFGRPGGRWDNHGGWIKFRTRADVDWFLLRWM